MQVLTVGFDRETTDRLSAALRDAGHQVLGATGRSSGRTLAKVIRPDAVVVPDGAAGQEAWGWVVDLLAGARRVALAGGADPAAALAGASGAEALAEPMGRDASPPPLPTPDGEGPERATPPAARAPASAVGPRQAAEDETAPPDLEDKLVQVRFADYHRILEVQPGATAYVIREQYQRLSRLYDPTGWPGPVHAEDVPVLDEIGRGIEDAWAVLGDPELRARYEQALERGSRAAAEPRR
ncbi:MAG: J domain-containing protein [Myxococcota bacterium]